MRTALKSNSLHSDSQPNLVPRRPVAIIALHWGTALVGLAVVALILGRELADGKAMRALLLDGHRAFGALVLALTLARVAVRIRHHPLSESVDASAAHRLVIAAMHLALYGLLVAVPVLGWALTNAHGQPVSVFGLFALPSLLERDSDLADTLGDLHETAAWCLVGAVGLHVAAALWHHFVRRDPVLLAMLPHGDPAHLRRASPSPDLAAIPSESTEAST